MNKLRVIDLLNKIANGKEIPKKIKYDNDIWNYDEISRDYILIDKSGEEALICEELNLMFALNDEVEIIEEVKISTLKKLDIEKDYNGKGDMLINQMASTDYQMLQVANKINEIIDYLEEKE